MASAATTTMPPPSLPFGAAMTNGNIGDKVAAVREWWGGVNAVIRRCICDKRIGGDSKYNGMYSMEAIL